MLVRFRKILYYTQSYAVHISSNILENVIKSNKKLFIYNKSSLKVYIINLVNEIIIGYFQPTYKFYEK